ncbi:unnamed protein product [Schistosoma margrebowiei]|uniref:Uncharacterized protein n=1 Tax=Schistosoma margrebowiei TaxID=48269 RepID=A0AA84ZRI2_9TREM|nr:unnamed protein product [Schistosoma margrebowiei]
MVYTSQILLMLLLIIVNTDYSLPLVCYSCRVCPGPFDPSSQTVRNLSSSKWRTTVTEIYHIQRWIISLESSPTCSESTNIYNCGFTLLDLILTRDV